VTSVAQNTRFQEGIVTDCVKYVNQSISVGKFTSDRIVNIDETNIYFDMTANKTLEIHATRSVPAKGTGCSNRCTVLLGCTMDGKMLPPFIVFVGKKTGRIVREWMGETEFPKSCFYTVQDKGWIDKNAFMEWIQKVWRPFCNDKGDTTYLLMDEFAVHKAATCTTEIQSCGTQFDLIYGGYTPLLQVLDVGVNKDFKKFVREGFQAFMIANVENRKPTRLDVARWIASACEQITEECICNTWDGIGYKV
jgi:hypothetical protein